MSELTSSDPLLREQGDRSRARAGEYDEWFEPRGRYDRGPGRNAHWPAGGQALDRAQGGTGAPLAGPARERLP